MLEKYLEDLKPQVDELFAKDSSGHDVSHLERTMNAALYLQKMEGGDRVVIGIAALLHDVHRIMEAEVGHFVSPTESLGPIREMLRKVNMPEDQIERICFCVDHHEDYNWNGDNVDDLDALIVQDADNLDAIGAIGIARGFLFGGAHNIAMYDPNIPINENNDYTEEGNKGESTIHHFFHKSFKLAKNMNTKTGKKLAEQRIAYMRAFVDEFLLEWNAEY